MLPAKKEKKNRGIGLQVFPGKTKTKPPRGHGKNPPRGPGGKPTTCSWEKTHHVLLGKTHFFVMTARGHNKLLTMYAAPFRQRGLVRGFSCRFFNAIDMKPAVTSFRRCGGAPQNPNVNYINFEPL